MNRVAVIFREGKRGGGGRREERLDERRDGEEGARKKGGKKKCATTARHGKLNKDENLVQQYVAYIKEVHITLQGQQKKDKEDEGKKKRRRFWRLPSGFSRLVPIFPNCWNGRVSSPSPSFSPSLLPSFL